MRKQLQVDQLLNLENTIFQVVVGGRFYPITPPLGHFLLDIWKHGGTPIFKSLVEMLPVYPPISGNFRKWRVKNIVSSRWVIGK